MPDSVIRAVANYVIVIPVIAFALAMWLHPGQPKDLVLRGIVVLVASVGLASLGGALFEDPRPFVTLHRLPLVPHEPDNGFPSDHTLLGFAISILIWPTSRVLSAVGLFAAAMVGWARIAALIHSPLDIAGSIVMAIVANLLGYALVALIKNRAERTTNVDSGGVASG